MGPRPDGRGRLIGTRIITVWFAGVNGAATGWPRKARGRAQGVLAGLGRQWGRDRMAAEGVPLNLNRSILPASMGPRPDGRGRPDANAQGRMAVSMASMGPRPDGRGRFNGLVAQYSDTKASMGPRPDGRGRRSAWAAQPPALRGVNGAATGWPRKARRAGHGAAQADRASMGPRPDGRGRGRGAAGTRACGPCVNGAATGWPRKAGTACGWATTASTRQWGRDRMAAEGPRRRRRTATRPPASMGPRPDGRGRDAPTTPSRGTPCVNGAATGWPRKGSTRLRRQAPQPCVNGAATGWPRKEHGCFIAEYEAQASMGPRPDGRGRAHRRGWWPPMCRVNGAATGWPRKDCKTRRRGRRQVRASMGPRPDGRGRPQVRARRAEPPGVNGAATGWPRKAVCARCTRRAQMCVNGAATGWPRKGSRRGQCTRSRMPASMGPRPDGRGRASATSRSPNGTTRVNGAATGWPRKAALRSSMRTVRSRQWGRDRMAAEGPPACRPSRLILNASMGPRPDGRGRRAASQALCALAMASMGPRPDGRGR